MTAENQFIKDLRNILYMSQLFRYQLEGFKSMDITPTFMKVDCQNTINSLNRFMSDCAYKSPKAWELVKQDLSKDELHDINLLLEFASTIKNVGELVEVLEHHMKTQAA